MDNDRPPMSSEYLSLPDDDSDWGEPATEETAQELRSLGSQFAQTFAGAEEATATFDITTIQKLMAMIEKEIPFFFQGVGVSTMAKQLKHYKEIKPQIDAGVAGADKELKRNIDCKLPTTVLGFTIEELAKLRGRAVQARLLTTGKSAHPSLVVTFPDNTESPGVQVDFQNKFARTPPTTRPHQVLLPHITREYTYSYAVVKNLDSGMLVTYRNPPYISHPLTGDGLKTIDEYFINS